MNLRRYNKIVPNLSLYEEYHSVLGDDEERAAKRKEEKKKKTALQSNPFSSNLFF